MLDFLHRNARWIAGGFLLTFFSSFGQTFFVSGSIGDWREEFDLSQGEIGRLYMYATLASAACLPYVGRLVDLIPEHKTVAIVVPALSAATLMAAFAPTVSILFVAIFLLRLFGQGMMTHIALTATGRWFEADRGRAISVVTLGHQAGEATLPLLFASVAAVAGYRFGWFVGSILLIAICLPLGVWAYQKPREPEAIDPTHDESRRIPPRDWTRGDVMRDPIFWVLLIGVLAPPFIGTTIFYHQDSLTALNQWPPTLFAKSMVIMAAATVLMALVTGAIVDRVGAVQVLPYFLLPLAAACFVMAVSKSSGSLFGAMTLLGISYGVSSTLFGAIWPEVYGTAHLGAIRSMIVSVMVIATAAGPGATGTLMDWGIALPTQIQFLGGYCLTASIAMAIAALLLGRRQKESLETVN